MTMLTQSYTRKGLLVEHIEGGVLGFIEPQSSAYDELPNSILQLSIT